MEEISKFLTNVGLITSNGPWGHNVMSCEWTHQISDEPLLIAVSISRGLAYGGKTTFENISATNEFGVNIASVDQNIVSSIAGNNHGKQIDKIALLKELGVTFYQAKSIKTLMVEGACLNAECKVIKVIDIGDHPTFIGEVQNIRQVDKEPIIYHKGKYFKLGEQIHKPEQSKLEEIDQLIKKYKK